MFLKSSKTDYMKGSTLKPGIQYSTVQYSTVQGGGGLGKWIQKRYADLYTILIAGKESLLNNGTTQGNTSPKHGKKRRKAGRKGRGPRTLNLQWTSQLAQATYDVKSCHGDV